MIGKSVIKIRQALVSVRVPLDALPTKRKIIRYCNSNNNNNNNNNNKYNSNNNNNNTSKDDKNSND